MNSRVELQYILEAILGSRNVYFQPPPSIQINYPAIVYQREDLPKRFADNGTYILRHSYQVTVIDKNPDSPIVEAIAKLPQCRFDRHYVSDNLNHDVFRIFY